MLYLSQNYRKTLRELVERRKATKGGITFARIAEGTGIQSTYLSNVLQGRGDLSLDQMFQVCRFLEVPEAETDYLMLLLEWERCRVKERKQSLEKKLAAIRDEHLKTKGHVSADPVAETELGLTEYYLDPWCKVVHVFLGIPSYASHSSRIAEALGFSLERLEAVLGILERVGYISRKGEAVKVLVRHRHLPEDSPLCLPHQTLMRTNSLEQMQRLGRKQRYNVSVTFTGTEETRIKIQSEFLKFLKTAESQVKAGRSEPQVFQLNFDLFRWGVPP